MNPRTLTAYIDWRVYALCWTMPATSTLEDIALRAGLDMPGLRACLSRLDTRYPGLSWAYVGRA